MSSGVNKLATERNQRIILELASQPGNDICADCKARNPRWASHNLGIFICVGCASVHRKIGTHISKVKSLTLDSWTKEQVDRMKEMGNLKSNAIYNPNEVRHPPPPTLEDPTRDSELETYIRSKYEYRRFLDKNALVASKLGPSRSASSANSPASKPTVQRTTNPPPPSAPKTATDIAATMFSTAKPQLQSRITPPKPAGQTSSRVPEAQPLRPASQPVPVRNSAQQPSTATKPGDVWTDLISLQEPATNASLPLQYQPNGTGYSTLPVNNGTPSVLPNMLGTNTLFANTAGSPIGNPTANAFLQQPSLAPNPFSQQQFPSQTLMSPFSATTTTPLTFQHNTPQIPQSFAQPNLLFQNQFQPQIAPTPFYQPQPQPLLTSPQQSAHSQLLSSSPNSQFIPSHSPQPQSTTPNSLPFNYNINNNLGMGVGYMGHSPQPAMSVQPNGQFGPGFAQQPMSNPFGQIQFAQGAFPSQTTQWGPM